MRVIDSSAMPALSMTVSRGDVLEVEEAADAEVGDDADRQA